AALELFRPDGRLNDRVWATAAIAAAVAEVAGERWAKTCRTLQDVRALTFLDRLEQGVVQAEPRAEGGDALGKWWRLEAGEGGREGWGGGGGKEGVAAVLTTAVQAQICRQLGSDWQAAAARVGRVLARTVRASSVVGCMNSVVRMHQARHRRLTQGLLDWKWL